MQLVIGNKNYSSWSLRPWLLLAEYGVAFEEVRIPLDTEKTQSLIAAHSGAGKVPVLHDGNLVVWDSLAICEYVSERYLDGRGWPADAAVRAQARASAAEMHSGFFELRAKMPMNCRATGRRVAMTPGLERDVNRIIDLWTTLRHEYASQGPWLFGTFSIADCMYAPVVSRFHTYGVSVSDVAADYMGHVLANPGMQRWFAQAAEETETIDDAEVGA